MGSFKRLGAELILSAQGLTKIFGSAPPFVAVRGASLDLCPGDKVAILGRSGSGKSTLLAMLGALSRPTAGKLLLNGADIWSFSEEERALYRSRQAGFVFQFPSLLANLTALGNVAAPALLSRTMEPERAYAKAFKLLSRTGLAGRADSFPGSLSGGEQRRVAIARALINSPSFLLADEPTSDLDEDTEAGIMGLLEELQASEGFGFVLVTHSPALASHAERVYAMRQGILETAEPPVPGVESAPRPYRSGALLEDPLPPTAAPAKPQAAARLGAELWRTAEPFAIWGAVILGGVLLANLGAAKYQEKHLLEREQRKAQLADMALSRLQAELQSVEDLGDGRYELAVSLRNAGGDAPIYVMLPDMRAYIQVGKVWQEVPVEASGSNPGGVSKIEGKSVFRYAFEARVKDFTQLLPNYMHVRFSESMLVSPSKMPRGDVFERKDNFYVYLKPFDISDEVILKRMKFPGKPPVWIPMPPH
jgi:putative ABC transport system ATP-binding protein/macrolide transport system ATP-binding/permease protein/lipoprotein-releasing system ATP-binding protein